MLHATSRPATLARYLWAGPTTFLGIIAALTSVSLPRVQGSILLCRSDRGFARRFLVDRGYCAITLGHLVLMSREAPADVLTHEMVHVRQSERLGPFFIPAYLCAMAITRLRGKDPYWDNPFEVAARKSPPLFPPGPMA